MATKSKTKTNRHSGGRPPKPDKAAWGQITCVLRQETIERIREGAGSKHFGVYLQAHLNRYPPPTREQYLALTDTEPHWVIFKRKRMPTIIAAGSLSHEAKRLQRERARRDRLTPSQRAWEDSIRSAVAQDYDKSRKAPAG